MTHDVYKYIFNEAIPAQQLEDTFLLAFLAVECLHGRSRARMDIRFTPDKPNRIYTIDTSTDVGRDLNRIFIGFATIEYGASAVKIERTLRSAK